MVVPFFKNKVSVRKKQTNRGTKWKRSSKTLGEYMDVIAIAKRCFAMMTMD